MKKFTLIIVLVSASLHCAFANSFEPYGSSDLSSEEGFGSCVCGTGRQNPCRGVTGTKTVTCGNSLRNCYLQCDNTNCSVQTCAAGTVYNKTSNTCVACSSIPSNYQISADNTHCVCAQGFQPGRGGCVACPAGSIINQYNCSCPAGSVVNSQLTPPTCQACPVNSTADRDQDECNCDATLFFNSQKWSCDTCPGSWVQTGTGRRTSLVCTCPAGQIFYEPNVTCLTCTAPAVADNDGDDCVCKGRNTFYNYVSNACQCYNGYAPSSTGTGCTFVGFSTTAAAAGK